MTDDVSWGVQDLMYNENVVNAREHDDLLYGDMGDVLYVLYKMLL